MLGYLVCNPNWSVLVDLQHVDTVSKIFNETLFGVLALMKLRVTHFMPYDCIFYSRSR